ncbi:MAG TPA: hypothetical protein VGG03_06440 [Thermoanaerobaculia bacterium]|jgi:hypothetical protein
MRTIQFLLKNKDLLEVIFTILGSVAAILLGIMAIVLTKSQLKISRRELQLNEAQACSYLRTIWKQCSSATAPSDACDCVEVWNDAPALTGLAMIDFALLELSRPSDPRFGTRHLRVFYLFDREYTGQGTGLIVTLLARRSPPMFATPANVTPHWNRLRRELQSAGYQATLRVLLYVNYQNTYGRGTLQLLEVPTNLLQSDINAPSFPRIFSSAASKRLIEPAIPRWLDNLSVDEIERELPQMPDLSGVLDNPNASGGDA